MRVVVATPPEPVITLAEAKQHLRADGGDDDVLIAGYLAAATGHLDGPDGWLGRAIGVQTLEARFDTYEADRLRLPYKPIVDIVKISWLNQSRALVEGVPADYELIDDTVYPIAAAPWSGMLVGREAMRIRYRAGYAPDESGEVARSTLPPAIRVAILLMTEDLYRNRGESVIGTIAAQVQMAPNVQSLLTPFRVYT